MNPTLLQLGRQLSSIWKELGLNQRLSVVATAVVVLGGLIGLGFWSSRTDYRLLYGRLDDAEAAKVVAALTDAKIPYKVGANGSSIYVPGNQVDVMRMQLAAKGIPRNDGGVGFELLDRQSFGVSDVLQRANLQRALQGELARTISRLDEVQSASVLIVVPENRLLIDQKKRPTASVFVRTRGIQQLSPGSVNSIRFLVANAVEGLQASQVTVVDNHGNLVAASTEGDSNAGLTSTQLQARQHLEQYLARKAEGMLEAVVGLGQAVVRVAAEINFDTKTLTEEKFDPEGQVIRSSTINDENNDSTTASGQGGVPGTATNASIDTNAAPAVPVTNSRLKKKLTTNQYENGKTVSNTVQGAGGLRRLSAAVFVAARFEGTGTDRKLAPRSPEELQKLRRIVQSALGIQTEADATRRDEITLEEIKFDDRLGTELNQQLDQQQKRQFWWELGGSLAYPALGLVVLGVFWRSFKRTPLDSIPLGIPVGQLAGNGHAVVPGQATRPGDWSRPAEPGVVTVDVLNQLIRENPGNMTQAIRSWLTKSKPS